MLLETTALVPPLAFSSSRLKNPESYQNISNQSINLSIFPPLLIIKILLYDMVPQSEEMLAVTPVTGRKLLSHCPVGQLQCSCCHTPIKGTGASSVLSKWLYLLYATERKWEEKKKKKTVSNIQVSSHTLKAAFLEVKESSDKANYHLACNSGLFCITIVPWS